jgi:hypothetical protein
MFGRKTSQAQTDANRLNAQKSTGPTTQQGKERSRCNAFRHGLTSQVTIMTDPEREAQEKFIKAYVEDLAPEGFQQTQFAQSIAHDQWRMNRIRAIEENEFATGFEGKPGNLICSHPEIHSAMAASATFFDEPDSFATLSLYEQRIHRNFHRNLKAFQQLRAEPKPTRAADIPAPVENVENEKPLTMAASAVAQPSPESTTSPEIGFDSSNWNKAPDYVPNTPHAKPLPNPDPAPSTGREGGVPSSHFNPAPFLP